MNYKDEEDQWSSKYFIPVCCFILFNVGDYVGRFFAEYIKWPKPGRLGMIIVFLLTMLRFAFIPLFLHCHIPNGRQYTSDVFLSDWFYIIFMILFSLSNGYLSNICMMSAPQIVNKAEGQTAASLMVALLGLGLGSGALLSNAVKMLIWKLISSTYDVYIIFTQKMLPHYWYLNVNKEYFSTDCKVT